MNERYTLPKTISGFVIVTIIFIWAIVSFTGVTLPDAVIRIMGILEIIAIPVFVFCSIRSRR